MKEGLFDVSRLGIFRVTIVIHDIDGLLTHRFVEIRKETCLVVVLFGRDCALLRNEDAGMNRTRLLQLPAC